MVEQKILEYDLTKLCDKGKGLVHFVPVSNTPDLEICDTGLQITQFKILGDPMIQSKGCIEISCEGCKKKPDGFEVKLFNQPYK